jgi:WD40 repeat protein
MLATMLVVAAAPLESAEAQLVVKAEILLGKLPSDAAADIPLRRPHPWEVYDTGSALYALAARQVAFSPDGNRMAYIDPTTRKVHLEASESEEYEQAQCLTFSPDSSRLAYMACPAESGCFVVVDGLKHRTYPNLVLGEFVFSPDSKHVAYVAIFKSGARRLVVDGVEQGKQYSWIRSLVFTRDGRLAFAAGSATGVGVHIVVDGVEGKAYDWIGWPYFSPDGQHLAHVGGAGSGKHERRRMVVDGVEGREYWRFSEPVFSPDGRRVAYRAALKAPHRLDLKVRYEKRNAVVVVDGKESKAHSLDLRMRGKAALDGNWIVPTIVFSQDGKRVAYAASEGISKKFIVIDGEPGQERYQGVAGLSFSPDGTRFAFAAKLDSKIFAVIDGVEHPTNIAGSFPRNPATAGAPIFSPDSRHVAFVRSRTGVGKKFWKGKVGGELEIVVDGVASETYDRIADLVWEGPRTVRTVACRKGQCFRVELELVQAGV